MLKRSDIVQIPFPFSEKGTQQYRPVLLLTTPDEFGDFLAAAITSHPAHIDVLALKDDDLVAGHLPKASWILASRLFSLNRDRIIATLGSIKPEVFERLHWEICVRLGSQPLQANGAWESGDE